MNWLVKSAPLLEQNQGVLSKDGEAVVQLKRNYIFLRFPPNVGFFSRDALKWELWADI